jgi:hypothetical protein
VAEHSINLGHLPWPKDPGNGPFIREIIKTGLHTNNINRKNGYSLNGSQMPLIHKVKKIMNFLYMEKTHLLLT